MNNQVNLSQKSNMNKIGYHSVLREVLQTVCNCTQKKNKMVPTDNEILQSRQLYYKGHMAKLTLL